MFFTRTAENGAAPREEIDMDALSRGAGTALVALSTIAFASPAGAQNYAILHSFAGVEGAAPQAGVTFFPGSRYAVLYASTSAGGPSLSTPGAPRGGAGTLFELCATLTCSNGHVDNWRVLHGFVGSDGQNPVGSVTRLRGSLSENVYGSTLAGGTYGGGTIFAIDARSGRTSVLHSFGNGTDGKSPSSGLTYANGTLYGTTASGGAYGGGTIFAVDVASGRERPLYSFGHGSDGISPTADLTVRNGLLYGTTSGGGAYGGGTVFELDPVSAGETVLHSFGNGTDGKNPRAGLTYRNSAIFGNEFYGTTSQGGAFGLGTIFALSLSSGAESVRYSFGNGSDGAVPDAGLTYAGNDIFYGTTSGGGTYGGGTVFALDDELAADEAGFETVVHAFGSGQDGVQPVAALTQVSGTLFGTTSAGGAYGQGTIFGIAPAPPPNPITVYPVPTVPSFPAGIAAGPDGALWFTENTLNRIGRITTSGTVTEFPTTVETNSITGGPDGAIWFTSNTYHAIVRMTTAGTVTNVFSTGNLSPHFITTGSDGALWFTTYGNAIGRITTSGAVTSYPTPANEATTWTITPGPDGALWFTQVDGDYLARVRPGLPLRRGTGTRFPRFSGNDIGRITTAGAVTEFPASTLGPALNITAGPDGALWFTEYNAAIGRISTSGTIAEFPTPAQLTGDEGIAPGSDGAVWFAGLGGNAIGRITVTGTISGLPVPTAGPFPEVLAAGPDAAIWFTEGQHNAGGRGWIGRVQVPATIPNAGARLHPRPASAHATRRANRFGAISALATPGYDRNVPSSSEKK
jgi:virginiamycin B lyase